MPFAGVDVQAAVRKRANRKAPGEDNMPTRLLNTSGALGIFALTQLYSAIRLSGWECTLAGQLKADDLASTSGVPQGLTDCDRRAQRS